MRVPRVPPGVSVLLIVLVVLGIATLWAHIHDTREVRKHVQMTCIDLSREYELTPDGPDLTALKGTLEAAGCTKLPGLSK